MSTMSSVIVSKSVSAPPTPPSSPTALIIESSSDTIIRVKWTIGTGSVSSYTINISSPSTSSISGISSSSFSGYNITGLTSSTTYVFTIQALNSGGNASSTSISAMTLHTNADLFLKAGTYVDSSGLMNANSTQFNKGVNMISRLSPITLNTNCEFSFYSLFNSLSSFKTMMSGTNLKTMYIAFSPTSAGDLLLFNLPTYGISINPISTNWYWIYSGGSGGSFYDATTFKYTDSTNNGVPPTFVTNGSVIYHFFLNVDGAGYMNWYIYNTSGTLICPPTGKNKLVNVFSGTYITEMYIGSTGYNGNVGASNKLYYANIFNSQLTPTQMTNLASQWSSNNE